MVFATLKWKCPILSWPSAKVGQDGSPAYRRDGEGRAGRAEKREGKRGSERAREGERGRERAREGDRGREGKRAREVDHAQHTVECSKHMDQLEQWLAQLSVC
eukprot:372004-Prymnesium_polylepis.2